MNVMPEGTRYSGGCHDNSIAFATYFMALGGVYYPLEGDDLLLRHRRMGRACEGADTGKGEIDNSSGRFAFIFYYFFYFLLLYLIRILIQSFYSHSARVAAAAS